ncbi:hypothetical protein WOLCODRAFT_25516 [Wolfiporia cocos MD-104 SS10]|uniref:Golgi apparatus membrane protein TVP38 n=1 Tax=Wolfiporia cocos (strain MD-104) TaxID=742152 RepID=A0A2H3JUW9_WOLCO|nr:hypothetical protein WOLCODRAFT_25516 [Wolfiporia cocos MD-104 SS10]
MASYPGYASNQASPHRSPYPNSRSNSNAPAQSYPPHGAPYDPNRASFASDDSQDAIGKPKPGDAVVNMRDIMRTPSPTPSEAEELAKNSLVDWKAMMNWRYWIRKEWTWYYVIFILAFIGVVLFSIYHDTIVRWLQPAANWMHRTPFGWAIPIAILFVISFPPLFGHEIVAILVGLTWGLWVGFAIVAAGTALGEIGNFYAFKYCCAARGEKLERNKLSYACLARVVRDGGFKIALIARLSAIPGHFTTAVFATCGMSIWTFIIAAILSTPKQFITVYLGVTLEQSENGSGRNNQITKDAVLGVTVILTFVAMWYIYNKMHHAKPLVIYDRRKARQAKMMHDARRAAFGLQTMSQSSTSVAFNPNISDSELPLNPSGTTFGASSYQQWDENGRAVGHAGDPTLYVPVPKRAQSRSPAFAPTHRPQEHADSVGPGAAYPTGERAQYRPAPARQDTSDSITLVHERVGADGRALPNPFTGSAPPASAGAQYAAYRGPAGVPAGPPTAPLPAPYAFAPAHAYSFSQPRAEPQPPFAAPYESTPQPFAAPYEGAPQAYGGAVPPGYQMPGLR